MAFPLDNSYLLLQLRASYLSLQESQQYAVRILNDDSPSSPPISFNNPIHSRSKKKLDYTLKDGGLIDNGAKLHNVPNLEQINEETKLDVLTDELADDQKVTLNHVELSNVELPSIANDPLDADLPLDLNGDADEYSEYTDSKAGAFNIKQVKKKSRLFNDSDSLSLSDDDIKISKKVEKRRGRFSLKKIDTKNSVDDSKKSKPIRNKLFDESVTSEESPWKSKNNRGNDDNVVNKENTDDHAFIDDVAYSIDTIGDDNVEERLYSKVSTGRGRAFSIDSDFGVPVSKETGRIMTNLLDYENEEVHTLDDGTISQGSKSVGSVSFLDSDASSDGSLDSDAEFSDSSFGSAFTDGNASLLDNSIISSSYPNLSTDFLGQPQSFSRKLRSKRAGSNSMENFPRVSSNANLKNTSISQTSLVSNVKAVSSMKSFTSLKRAVMTFEKINPKPEQKSSNLSSLIHSKFKNLEINPLSHYQFVGKGSDTSVKSVDINIFFKGKILFHDLSMKDNVSIFDCIGYILFKFTRLFGFNEISLNPNHWRLELTDDECDDYGEFGYLNRTRLLASYNNPKYLSLSEVDAEQIKINEQQTPISTEFKEKLRLFEEDIDPVLTQQTSGLAVELHVFIQPLKKTIVYSSTLLTTIGQVKQEICLKEGLDSSGLIFRKLINFEELNGIIDEDKHPVLSESGLLSDLSSHALIMSEAVTKTNDDFNQTRKLTFQAQITPSDYTLKDEQFDTPEHIKTFEEKTLSKKPTDPKRNKIEQLRKETTSGKQLEDLMKGKNIDLPTNLTLIYFKWKVWRKKPAILNKLERFFILDGDYIWLTPPDEINNTNIYGVLASEGGSHHHLRFNNYYKSQLTKTNQFHITQIVKLKQYKKTPALFRVIVRKQNDSGAQILKKYYLDAETPTICQEIIDKIHWTQKVYSISIMNGG